MKRELELTMQQKLRRLQAKLVSKAAVKTKPCSTPDLAHHTLVALLSPIVQSRLVLFRPSVAVSDRVYSCAHRSSVIERGGGRCPSVQVGAKEARAEARAEDAITARAEELKRLELKLELKMPKRSSWSEGG